MRALLAAAVAVLVVGTLPPSVDAQRYPPNPFGGRTLYVDPSSSAAGDPALGAIAARSSADWFGDWNALSRVQQDVDARLDEIAAAGAYPVLVAYNIPQRDCAGHSSGGAGSADGYRAWIRAFTSGIGSRRAAVILEPDALAGLDCLSPAGRTQRLGLLADATRTLAAGGNVAVYLDAGHAGWIDPHVMIDRLIAAGVVHARGFALNVASFGRTADQIAYGRRIAPAIGWKRFVVDTSRNGRGPAAGIPDAWCNPPGRGLGHAPTAATGDALVDAFLWIKRPGESDGTCRGGPPAGTWWRDYAVGLVERAA